MPPVQVLEEAAEEAAEAAAWYEAERPGLGSDFFEAIEAAIDLIEEGLPLLPVQGNTRQLGARRVILKRFPYDIIVLDEPDQVIVVAIAHHARKPGYWRDRLSP